MGSKNWLFLRGLVRESGHWQNFINQFSQKFAKDSTIAIDLPGTGIYYQDQSPCDIPQMVSELRTNLLQTYPNIFSKPTNIFAISLGAMIAIEWIFQHPKDFGSAVFINTSLRGINPLYQRIRPRNYFNILKALTTMSIQERESIILSLSSNKRPLDQKVLKDWIEIQKRHPVSKQNALRQLKAAATYKASREKPNIPILLLRSKDMLVNSICSEKIAHLWNAQLKTNDWAGHDITLDDPNWVIDHVKAWQTEIQK